MKFTYDKIYVPSAPKIMIHLAFPDRSFSIGPLAAFVDTGADSTIVPIRHLRVLRAIAIENANLRSQWGEHRRVKIFRVDIGIGDIRFPSIEVVGDDRGNEIILGRNLLNKLVITLNGPKQELEIKD